MVIFVNDYYLFVWLLACLLALLCFALLCFALLCFALLCFALLCFALLCFACLLACWFYFLLLLFVFGGLVGGLIA